MMHAIETKRTDAGPKNEDEQTIVGVVDGVIESLERNYATMVAQLLPDGPEVDYATISLLVCDELTATQRARIWSAIVTWKQWHDAYWELALAWESDEDQLDR